MKIKYISWVPAVLIMILIFSYSSKPADNSNENSMKVVNRLIQIYENITHNSLESEQRAEIEETLNHIVRKGAHFCEYALLAAAISFYFLMQNIVSSKRFLLSVMISFFYAATDEFHQTFVTGRTGMFKDVMLDTAGAATGSLIFLLILIILSRIKNKCLTN